jgi:hypothetical protein
MANGCEPAVDGQIARCRQEVTMRSGSDRRTSVATEIAEGGQAALDAFARMRDASLPLEDRYDPGFTDHDPAAGQQLGLA